MRTAALCYLAALFALGPLACSPTTYDSTGEFYRQHPEYDPADHTPAQFHPADNDN